MPSHYYAYLGDREAEKSWWLEPGSFSKSEHSLWNERSPAKSDLLDHSLCRYGTWHNALSCTIFQYKPAGWLGPCCHQGRACWRGELVFTCGCGSIYGSRQTNFMVFLQTLDGLELFPVISQQCPSFDLISRSKNAKAQLWRSECTDSSVPWGKGSAL